MPIALPNLGFAGLVALGRIRLSQENVAISHGLPEPEQLRVNLYRLMARLLALPPDRELLDTLGALSGDDTDLGAAIGDLSAAAQALSENAAREEYHDLFIGVGRGELVPFGSYYLTGFLNEKPLARLRDDMAPLGIARSPDAKEPEDHVGALMDMMAGLIDGSFGQRQPLETQKAFFKKHIGSWAEHFFADLEKAPSAHLFRPVGTIGRRFLEIEEAGFDM
ncbi:MAG TPA: molecular chaperone TorD [Aurantimonas coralicida]|uniref:Molecular chaperone TorD n=1 Tax=Aurantimonas coralicida TaxID=182270 RepID=A0A9C9TGC7_9HYPH|nr:molecular chaperone TorD [Aurantimonas coralicida]HEU00285.1 molecular chaperone TorD [Aurantimonas coralicida]